MNNKLLLNEDLWRHSIEAALDKCSAHLKRVRERREIVSLIIIHTCTGKFSISCMLGISIFVKHVLSHAVNAIS